MCLRPTHMDESLPTCHAEHHMGLRPINGDENRVEPTLYHGSGVER
jgi:hypothetical protein